MTWFRGDNQMTDELALASQHREALANRILLMRTGNLMSFQLSPFEVDMTALSLATAERSLAAYDRKISRLEATS
jgi:hypothetical protein